MPLYPDHPIVTNMEHTGYPTGRAPEYPHCPICAGEEIGSVYVNEDENVIGCEDCITKQSTEDIQAFDENMTCPVCGRKEAEFAFTDRDGNLLGCDQCISERDAWSKEECFNRAGQ